MEISLLYRSKNDTPTGGIGRDTVDRLALRRLIEGLHLSGSDAEYCLRTLSAPLFNAEDIAYRRKILQDFAENPALLDELDRIWDRLSRLRKDQADLKKEKRAAIRTARGEAVPDAAKNLLQAAGLTLKRCLLLLDAAKRTLHACALTSQGLCRLKNELEEVTSPAIHPSLLRLCTQMEQYSEISGVAIRLRLNDGGAVVACDLMDRQSIPFSIPEAKKKRFLFGKRESDSVSAAAVDLRSCPLRSNLRAEAMQSLADLADRVSAALFDRFLTAGRELSFYRAALCYTEWLREKDVPTCFAELGGEVIAFERLYDPLLLQTMDAKMITPNDLSGDSARGLLITGANGSGKTVWLRSVGLMQIFTQAGLPIPALSAQVPLYRQIYTHFSSGEKELTADERAGRFEQEVRELAAMLDEIGTNGLVLLNETFQTTAYREGAEGLSHILRYLTEGGNRWILTTHLTELSVHLDSGELTALRADHTHRIQPI